MIRVVLDTNVLVAALRSRRGASFQVLRLLGGGCYVPLVSPPLCVEYEDVFSRPSMLPGYSPQDADDFLDYFLSQSIECRVYFLWRPFLPDPKDDLVLEIALAGSASLIVTHNVRDFVGAESMGIQVVTPDDFLAMLAPSS